MNTVGTDPNSPKRGWRKPALASVALFAVGVFAPGLALFLGIVLAVFGAALLARKLKPEWPRRRAWIVLGLSAVSFVAWAQGSTFERAREVAEQARIAQAVERDERERIEANRRSESEAREIETARRDEAERLAHAREQSETALAAIAGALDGFEASVSAFEAEIAGNRWDAARASMEALYERLWPLERPVEGVDIPEEIAALVARYAEGERAVERGEIGLVDEIFEIWVDDRCREQGEIDGVLRKLARQRKLAEEYVRDLHRRRSRELEASVSRCREVQRAAAVARCGEMPTSTAVRPYVYASLKTSLHDPESLRDLECGQVRPGDGCWALTCSYHARNRLGVLVREAVEVRVQHGQMIGMKKL